MRQVAARARVAALVGLYAKSPVSANMRAKSAFLSADKSRVVVETGHPISGTRAAAMIALELADLRFDRTLPASGTSTAWN